MQRHRGCGLKRRLCIGSLMYSDRHGNVQREQPRRHAQCEVLIGLGAYFRSRLAAMPVSPGDVVDMLLAQTGSLHRSSLRILRCRSSTAPPLSKPPLTCPACQRDLSRRRGANGRLLDFRARNLVPSEGVDVPGASVGVLVALLGPSVPLGPWVSRLLGNRVRAPRRGGAVAGEKSCSREYLARPPLALSPSPP